MQHENFISNERFNKFCNMSNEERMNLSCNDFLVSEIRWIASETPLNERERKFVELFYIDQNTHDAIAEIMQIDRKTSVKWSKIISNKLKTTCTKLFTK